MGFLVDITRRSSSLSNPAQWLVDLFGGGAESDSGVPVTSDSMMSESGVWCAVMFLASNIASLPCPLMKKDDKNKIKVRDHNLFKLINYQANNEMVAMVYRETCIYYLLLWGVSYSIITRNRLGKVSGLWPVHPDNVEVTRGRNSQLQYKILYPDGTDKTFQSEDILHIPGLGNGISGLSMIEYSKNSVGLTLAMRKFANLFFANGSNMGVIFEHPGQMSPEAHKNLTKSLAEGYSGLGVSHKAMVAEEGMQVHKAGSEPEKSQLIEGREFQITEVARWFNLPPHILKDLSRATFSNIEEMGLELITYTLRPTFIRIEQSYWAALLTPEEQKNHYFKHNAEALLRGDSAARIELYRGLFNMGSISPNEIRELEDRNPINEEWADDQYLQLNLVPAADLSGLQDDNYNNTPGGSGGGTNSKRELRATKKVNLIAAGRKRVQKRYAKLIHDAIEKIVNRGTISVNKEVKKQLGERSASDMETWINGFYDKFPEYVDKNVRNIFTSYMESMSELIYREIGEEPEITDELQADIDEYIDGYVSAYVRNSRQQMLSQNKEGGPEAVGTRSEEWHEKRADKETTKQIPSMSNMLATVIFVAAAYRPTWRNTGAETCPMCTKLNGRKVSRKNQPFVKKNESFTDNANNKTKFRKTLYPPLHGGCDCILTAG